MRNSYDTLASTKASLIILVVRFVSDFNLVIILFIFSYLFYSELPEIPFIVFAIFSINLLATFPTPSSSSFLVSRAYYTCAF